jgi:hypothetical protein
MSKKDMGVNLTIVSLVCLILLFEYSPTLEPQWAWRLARFGLLVLIFCALHLFAAGIKQEVRDELRGADGKAAAEPAASADRGGRSALPG